MIAQLNLAQGIASAVDLLRPSSVQSNRASALNARHADRRKVLLKWIYIVFFKTIGIYVCEHAPAQSQWQ